MRHAYAIDKSDTHRLHRSPTINMAMAALALLRGEELSAEALQSVLASDEMQPEWTEEKVRLAAVFVRATN